MAQKMIDLVKQTKRSVGVQTGCDEELYFYISDNKNAKVYFSVNEKERLFRLTVNTKSVALNQNDWKTLRKSLKEIDYLMSQECQQ